MVLSASDTWERIPVAYCWGSISHWLCISRAFSLNLWQNQIVKKIHFGLRALGHTNSMCVGGGGLVTGISNHRSGFPSRFYLRMHSAHFSYGYMTSDIKWGNPRLSRNGLLFLISIKGYFMCTIPQIGQYIPWPLLYQF